MSEYEIEPIPGLPGVPPEGERILWQGGPDRAALARAAFHVRGVAAYFGLLLIWSLTSALTGGSSFTGVILTMTAATAGIGLLYALAWGSARTTIYTLTNRRIVIRTGMAVPKCINLPLTKVETVGLAVRADGSGDIPLTLAGLPKIGYLALWPHARPWHFARPQPMLRAVPDAERIATMVARTCLAANPAGQLNTFEAQTRSAPLYPEQAAA